MTVDPWGELSWLADRLPEGPDVRFLGGLAAEERCSKAITLLPRLAYSLLVNVEDPPSVYTVRVRQKVEANRSQLISLGINFNEERISLLAPDEEIADLLSTCLKDSDRVTLWMDISSLPKRFFFLLAKLAINDPRVETLIIAYTQPGPAGYHRETLAEDPDEVRPLPGFAPDIEPSILCVAIGFESLGLPRFIGEYRDRRRDVFVIVPFPPGQPYSERIWRSLHRLNLSSAATIRRIPAIDAFGAFHLLSQLAPPSLTKPVALAPYGPKPISLGMALYAIKSYSPVFYTQPRIYHPDYTMGVGRSWAYCIKLRGIPRPQ